MACIRSTGKPSSFCTWEQSRNKFPVVVQKIPAFSKCRAFNLVCKFGTAPWERLRSAFSYKRTNPNAKNLSCNFSIRILNRDDCENEGQIKFRNASCCHGRRRRPCLRRLCRGVDRNGRGALIPVGLLRSFVIATRTGAAQNDSGRCRAAAQGGCCLPAIRIRQDAQEKNDDHRSPAGASCAA